MRRCSQSRHENSFAHVGICQQTPVGKTMLGETMQGGRGKKFKVKSEIGEKISDTKVR